MGLEQLSNQAQCATADPKRELDFFFQGLHVGVFFARRGGRLIGSHLLDALRSANSSASTCKPVQALSERD